MADFRKIFEILGLCHSVLATKQKNSEQVKLFSVLPDELAFVSFTKFCGFEFMGKQTDTENYVLKTENGMREYKLHYTLPFTSER